MDIQDSSIPKPSPEVRIDLSSEDMATDQACQDSCKTTRGRNEESNPMALQPSEIQGDSNLAEPSLDCNEESNPMVPQPSEIQGDSNPAEPPPEVCEEGSSQGMATDEAFQGGCEITNEVPEEGSSQGTTTDEASHDSSEIQDSSETTSVFAVKPAVQVKEKYRPLFEAAVKGDWKGAEEILKHDPKAITAPLLTTERGTGTVGDIAAMAGQDQFVENLVKRVRTTNEHLTLRTALCHAARRGGMRKIKELVNEVSNLDVDFALSIAIESAPRHKEVIWYLATQAKSFPEFDIVIDLIKAGHWDILLYLVKKHPKSMRSEVSQSILQISAYMKSFYRSGAQLNFWEKCVYQCITPSVDTSFDNAKHTEMARGVMEPATCCCCCCLGVMEPATCCCYCWWFKILLWNLATKSGKIIYRMLRAAPFINRIGELKCTHECLLELANLIFKGMKHHEKPSEILELTKDIVLGAAFSGIFEIVKLCLEQCPELMWDEEFTKQLIKRVVRARHVELFRLLNAYSTIRRLMHDLNTNCDLMAAVVEWSPQCIPADVSGSAFLMQRELQWFEVLEDGSSPLLQSLRIKMKKDESDHSKSPKLEPMETRKTYWDVFVEERKDLLQEAGRWMKDTSSSCSLVATLIITVAFAAAFTVPGSNDNAGIPIFLKKISFTLFVVADALALFSSVTATLMFLSILTSSYAAKDFLHSLPRKMILGLTFFFLSLASMLMAFGSALMIVLSKRWKWIYIPITLSAAVPVILFAILHLPLYVEMVESTYWPRLYRPMKIWK